MAHSAFGVTLSVQGASGVPSGQVTVALQLDNDTSVRGIQFNLLQTPHALALSGASTTQRSLGLDAEANEQDDGSITGVLIGLGSGSVTPGGGSVMELHFVVGAAVPLGTQVELRLSDARIADSDGNPLPTQTLDGEVAVTLPTASPTQTPTETPSSTATLAPTPTRTATHCVGDCNNSGGVTVDDLVKMANVALGKAAIATCMAGDTNRDGRITIDEVLTGVHNALVACP